MVIRVLFVHKKEYYLKIFIGETESDFYLNGIFKGKMVYTLKVGLTNGFAN